jgi:hypothetical protein
MESAMRRNFLCFGFLAVAIALTLSTHSLPLFGREAASKDMFVGNWKLNLEKSMVNRKGVLAHPTRPATRVYAVEGDGYRISIFDGTATTPTRSYFAKFDGKEYPDPRTAGRGEVGIHFRLSPNVIVREVIADGKPAEWATWTVSSDGNVLTTIGWDPATPEEQNIQVYDRQN